MHAPGNFSQKTSPRDDSNYTVLEQSQARRKLHRTNEITRLSLFLIVSELILTNVHERNRGRRMKLIIEENEPVFPKKRGTGPEKSKPRNIECTRQMCTPAFDGFRPKYEPIISHCYPSEFRQYLFSRLALIGEWKRGWISVSPPFFFFLVSFFYTAAKKFFNLLILIRTFKWIKIELLLIYINIGIYK